MSVTKRQLLEATRRQGDTIRGLEGELAVANEQLRAKDAQIEAWKALAGQAKAQLAKAIPELRDAWKAANREEHAALNARVLLSNYRDVVNGLLDMAATDWMHDQQTDPTRLRDAINRGERSINQDVTEQMDCDPEGHPTARRIAAMDSDTDRLIDANYPDLPPDPPADPAYWRAYAAGRRFTESLAKTSAAFAGFLDGFNGKGKPATVKVGPDSESFDIPY